MGDSSVVPQLSTIGAFNCKKQLAWNEEFVTLSATTNGGDAFNCKKQLAGIEEFVTLSDEEEGYVTQEEFVTLSDEEEGYITQEEFVTLSATTNGGDTLNCKKHVGSCELCLEEEEIAFLRSLGWEESGDEDDEEGALTEEEIATFYTYVSNHILQLKPKPALRFRRLHHNTPVFSFFT
nr:Uro-adherence factor A like [Ipomoea batatas]GMD11897.1 Uro-adherence factor A like [Ipomoea batatas]GMD11898.1 Uro-adherence factor A like [Ipomoea batatas]